MINVEQKTLCPLTKTTTVSTVKSQLNRFKHFCGQHYQESHTCILLTCNDEFEHETLPLATHYDGKHKNFSALSSHRTTSYVSYPSQRQLKQATF